MNNDYLYSDVKWIVSGGVIFMKKKWRLILSSLIVGVILIVGYLIMNPEKWLPSLYRTYIETIELNWDVTLPIPVSEKDIYSSRNGSHGDGDAITELLYDVPMDIQKIKDLSNSWVSGEELRINEFPNWVQDLLRTESIDKDADYFFIQKDSRDFIIFKLNGNKLTIYESYI